MHKKVFKVIYVLSLFVAILFSSQSYSQGKYNVSDDIQKEKVEDALEILKFNKDSFKRKKAFEYLFKNYKKAEPILYEELTDPLVSDLALANIFNIIIYGSREPDIKKFIQVGEKQLKKSKFMFYLNRYLYKKDPKAVSMLLVKMMVLGSLDVTISALNVIQKEKIQTMKKFLIHQFSLNDSYLLREKLLLTLSHLQLEQCDLKKVSQFMSSIDEGVRNAVTVVFRSYPKMFTFLKERFEDSDDFFERSTIIDIIVYFETSKADFFLLELLEDDFFVDKIMDAFLKRSSQGVNIVNKLIDIYEGAWRDSLRGSVLRVMSFAYRRQKSGGRKRIIRFFKEKLKEEDSEIVQYHLCKNILQTGYLDRELTRELKVLEKKKSSWRVRKIIRQIFDLKKEN